MGEPGNIDLKNRPVIQNPDGSVSNIKSKSFNLGWVEVLIPTAVKGKIVSDQEAIQHYRDTGEHLGKFTTPEEATSYAIQLHNAQEKLVGEPIKTEPLP